MADETAKPETETVEADETETTPTEKAKETPVSKEEFEKMQKALADANKEAAARRKKLEAYEKAEQERKEAEMTEAQKITARAEKAEAEAAALRKRDMQRTAADKVGLPAALALRLQGETAEELEADATALLALVPPADPKKPTPPRLGATSPGDPEQTLDKNQENFWLKKMGLA